ncbi:head GIN domain-containing protein [Kaistella sp.]|uniref:head GIN domain-containing protein n=1 Tax=Kaistella sp. TaxID=2782235 RepID=UPI003C4A8351
MKTLTISVLAAFFTLSSCNVKSDNGGFSFNVVPKVGTGPIKNKEFKMSFDEIKVAQSINAEVVKADEEKVVITAPSDIIEDILVENNNGKLYIHFKSGVNISARNVSAKIFAKDFSAVKASSSASIKIKDQFTQDRMNIEASSSADISGNLEANEMSINVSSSGSFTGKIWAVNLKSEATSSGDINISGKTKNANLSASSSGTLNAQKMIAENADIKASSSGDVSLSVSNQLNASASSSGDISIYRKGNLNIISKKESSGGSVSIQ